MTKGRRLMKPYGRLQEGIELHAAIQAEGNDAGATWPFLVVDAAALLDAHKEAVEALERWRIWWQGGVANFLFEDNPSMWVKGGEAIDAALTVLARAREQGVTG